MPYKNLDLDKISKRKYYDKNKEKIISAAKKCRLKLLQEDPLKYLLQQARFRATQRGIEFSITKKDLKLYKRCPVLGIKLKASTGNREDDGYSIDRLDSTKGYIPGNVKIISWRANRMKNGWSLNEFERLVSYLKKNKKEGLA